MFNDKNLVDEFEKLKKLKEELDKNIEEIKLKIINIAQERNTNILFGTHKKCSIKPYEKVVYPKDNTLLIEKIKSKGLYEQFSSINYFKLTPKILKNEVDKDIIDLTKKEKAFRVSLIDMGI